MNRRPLITLTTDFGFHDAYVAVMKAVILDVAPEATIVDISHEIHHQSVSEAAFLLWSAYRYFPPATVHVAVVDPGVGTSRRPVAIRARHGVYVGPDNGIFLSVLADQDAVDASTGELLGAEAVELANDAYWRKPLSHTFHGRDIFAPVGAHLARGVPVQMLGPVIPRLAPGERERVVVDEHGVYGVVMHIDHFGNAISNIPANLLPGRVRVEVGGWTIDGLSSSYQDDRLVALVGSSGLLEVAARNGSAAETLGLRPGDRVVVRPHE